MGCRRESPKSALPDWHPSWFFHSLYSMILDSYMLYFWKLFCIPLIIIFDFCNNHMKWVTVPLYRWGNLREVKLLRSLVKIQTLTVWLPSMGVPVFGKMCPFLKALSPLGFCLPSSDHRGHSLGNWSLALSHQTSPWYLGSGTPKSMH